MIFQRYLAPFVWVAGIAMSAMFTVDAAGRLSVPFFAVAGIAMSGACSHKQEPPAAASNATATRTLVPPSSATRRAAAESPPPSSGPPTTKGDPSVFFDFDSAALRDDAGPTLQEVSGNLRRRGDENLRIEGNCDELGTIEYNLALGEHRARAAKDYLVHLGVPQDRIATISYGSQRPKYAGTDERARARNRRDDFVVTR